MVSKAEFGEKLGGVVDEMGVVELPLDLARLEEYCELTGHDFAACKERGEAPTGYLMTFMDPVISRMFYQLYVKHPKLIKGVIHTTSTLESLAPVRLDAGPFQETMEIASIEEKHGSKGDYFSVDFKVTLMDAQEEEVAIDVHKFFLKV